ncbi:unnamed protein product [Notodromas monacha]|uniref:DNA mismatch repair proteins mutS family domain-containing protein n=1 Tax=Notodromas monacha TaxID=399045 RepID=A0A7R9BM91_9CRUS|nr:unnamed protein product [Notodromas monacha]CAG0916739.1 unnamed protein product [Notodromas monacha]
MKRQFSDTDGRSKKSRSGDEFESVPNLEEIVSFVIDGSNVDKVLLRQRDERTPLEKQVAEIKSEHPDVLLFVECGYRYRFFGEDAEIAKKELNIQANPSHSTLSGSIPHHRLKVHLQKLVHKELVQDDTSNCSRSILAIAETSTKPSDLGRKEVSIAVIAVDVGTREVLYDVFVDDLSRNALCKRLHRIHPCELICRIANLSPTTWKTLDVFVQSRYSADPVRLENVPADYFEFTDSLLTATSFFQHQNGEISQFGANFLRDSPAHLLGCFSALVRHLMAFDLTKALRSPENWVNLSNNLGAIDLPYFTCRSLDLTENFAYGKLEGSLMGFLNAVKIRCGRRLLRKWVSQPLSNVGEIHERLGAVENLVEFPELKGKMIAAFLSIPDVERVFAAAALRKVGPADFYKAVEALQRIAEAMRTLLNSEKTNIGSNFLRQLMHEIAESWDYCHMLLIPLYKEAAMEGNKCEVFLNAEKNPEISAIREKIDSTQKKLAAELQKCNEALGRQVVDQFVTRGMHEYLIEIPVTMLNIIPNNWICVSLTKRFARFHSPAVRSLIAQLSEFREKLTSASDVVWSQFLAIHEASGNFDKLSLAVLSLSKLDVLVGFSCVAAEQHLNRPLFIPGGHFEVENGFHPVVAQYVEQKTGKMAYVRNGFAFHVGSDQGLRCMVLSGPNMGGKSCFVKQTALTAIMAQIGSFIPGDSCKMTLFERIFVRVGGDATEGVFQVSGRLDGIVGGSSFLAETSQVAEILQRADERSLVVIDEFGRGTATFDGTALAVAVLNYLVHKVRCVCLFVTHYPEVCTFAENCSPVAENFHMGFLLQNKDADQDGRDHLGRKASRSDDVTLLFEVKPGIAPCSYGLNVAKMAGLPKEVVDLAARVADRMEDTSLRHRLDGIVGGSSFLAETSQVAEILQRADERSLVVIDEFGRGTATFDGTALAVAVLNYLVHKVRCVCLFVTHYPEVCAFAESCSPVAENFHMGFLLQNKDADQDGRDHLGRKASRSDDVTLLFEVKPGIAPCSYGLNVAKMAGLPKEVVDLAARVADRMEDTSLRHRIVWRAK